MKEDIKSAHTQEKQDTMKKDEAYLKNNWVKILSVKNISLKLQWQYTEQQFGHSWIRN